MQIFSNKFLILEHNYSDQFTISKDIDAESPIIIVCFLFGGGGQSVMLCFATSGLWMGVIQSLASDFHLRAHIPVVVSVERVPRSSRGVAGAPPTVHVVPVEISVVARRVPPGPVVRAGAIASPAIVVGVIGRELVAVVVC